MGLSDLIYLDNNATTRCDPRVVDKMMPFFSDIYGNPSNGYHLQGRLAQKEIDRAREKIAELINAQPWEVFFTSGATESNNLAIFGVKRIYAKDYRKKIVTCPIEHKAVLLPLKTLHDNGYDVVFLDVNSDGEICLPEAAFQIDASTLFVSIHVANNEIGTIMPIQELSEHAHQVGALFHTDAAQAVGKIPINVNEIGVDLLSMSAHKLYGPKGIGALFIRGGLKTLPLKPILYGGGQENGLRSGTLNVPGIVGFGEAARICLENITFEYERQKNLRDEFEKRLLCEIPSLKINAKRANRLPNTSSLTFPEVDADALLLNLENVMMSTGSACGSGTLEPSHVLQAIGLSREESQRTIRASLGKNTTKEQIEVAVRSIVLAHSSISHYG